MSNVVDSRVVEMQFDNKEFEKNAKQTIETLNTLKRALEENVNGSAFEELDRAAKNVDLSNIERSLDAITDRFSTMGIVGMRVIQNLTDALMNMVTNGINKIFDTISTGGAKRAKDVETARFQLQGLIDDQEEVEAVMKNAKDSVDGTAYAYNEAAKAASMFAATGLRSGEEMEKSLKAIAGVAATTSSEYEDIAHIFTTVAGQGKVMTEQLRQLETRGLNAAASLATYFNKVKDSTDDAHESLRDYLKVLAGASGETYLDSGGSGWSSYDEAYKASQKIFQKQYKARQKALNNEYNAVKKTLDTEYKDLKKTLDAEYTAKKKAYDEEYNALNKALSEEISALQKANSQRIKEANESYSEQVEAYRKATEARIALIDEEYTESIKLIDEERYNKLKAIDEELKAMQELEETESRKKIDEANAEKKATIEALAAKAKSTRAKKEAAKAVADIEKAIADQQEAWKREDRKNELQEEKDQINEDANLRKQEALTKRNEAVEAIQEESQAKLKEMQKTHEIEMEQMQEHMQAELQALQESKQAQLTSLREAQSIELESYRENQNLQLEAVRERQQEELEAIRERNNEELEALRDLNNDKLAEMKVASKYGVKALEDFNSELGFTEANIRDMVTDGMIDFDLFAQAMAETFGDHAKDANKTFEGAMANIRAALARTGEMFYKPFFKQEGEMVQLFNSIRIKINELNDAIKPLAQILATNILVVVKEIRSWIDRLDLSFRYFKNDADDTGFAFKKFQAIGIILTNVLIGLKNIFQAIGSYIRPVIVAFKEVFQFDYSGIQDATFSFKNFTESLKASEETASIIHDIFFGFFAVIRSGISIVANFIRKLKPLSFLFDTISTVVVTISNTIGNVILYFTEWATTSETLAEAIKTASDYVDKFIDKIKKIRNLIKDKFFKNFGGFDIGKYFAEGFFEGIKSVSVEILKRTVQFFKDLVEAIKDYLGIHSPSTLGQWLGEMFITGIQLGIELIFKTLIPFTINLFTTLIEGIKDFISSVDWGGIVTSVLDFITHWITEVTDAIAEGIPKALQAIGDFLTGVSDAASNFEFNEGEGSVGWNFVQALIVGIGNAIGALGAGIYKIAKTFFDILVNFFKDFSLKDAIMLAKEFIETFATNLISTLKEWKDAVAEALHNFFGDIGKDELLAIGAGIGIIYLFIKAVQTLIKFMNPLESVAMAINALKNALWGMTYNLRASALLKISLAIGVLVGVIVLLFEVLKNMSPGDTNKFVAATVVVGVATWAISYIAIEMMRMYNDINTINGALTQLTIGLKHIMSALSIKLIISSIISAISTIVLDVAILATIYKTDQEAFSASLRAVAGITSGIIAILSGIIILSDWLTKENTQVVKDLTFSMLAFAGGIILLTLAIQQICKLELSSDDFGKLAIVAGALGVLGILILMVKKLGSGKNGDGENVSRLQITLGTVIAFALLMIVVIRSIKKLAKEGLTITDNFQQLLLIAGILAVLTAVCYFLGKAGRASIGVTKYGSAVIGLGVLLIATLYSMKKLVEMPLEDYWKGLGRVTLVFIAMTIVCFAAQLVNSNDGYKSIIGVGMLVGALVIALGALSMLDGDKVNKAALALSVALIGLGAALYGAGQLSKAGLGTFGAILAMILAVVAIGYVMMSLTKFPWQQILAAGASISACLLAYGATFMMLSFSNTVRWATIGKFLLGCLAIGVIGIVLWWVAKDSKVNWKSLLAAAAGISSVLLAYGRVFRNLKEGNKVWVETIGKFLLGSLALIVIGGVLWLVAKENWSSILMAGTAVSEVIIAYGIVFTNLNKCNNVRIDTIGKFLLGSLALIVIGGVLYALAQFKWNNMLVAGTAVSEVILAYGHAFKNLDGVDVKGKTVAQFIAGCIGIAMIGAILAIVTDPSLIGLTDTKITWGEMLPTATAISEVLLALAYAISCLDGVEVTGSAIGSYLLGCVGIIAIGLVLGYMVSHMEATWESMLSTATAISEVLDAIAVAAVIISNVKPGDFNFASVGYFLEALIVAGILGYLMDQLNMDELSLSYQNAISFSIVLIAVGVLALILGIVGDVVKNVAWQSLLGKNGIILLFVAALPALLSGIVKLNDLIMGDNIDRAKKNMIGLGEAIGGFFGALIGGFLAYTGAGIHTMLEQIGAGLSAFMISSKIFFDNLDDFNEEKQNKMEFFVQSIATLAMSDFIESVAQIVDALTPFDNDPSARFRNLGKAINAFCNEIEENGSSLSGWDAKNYAGAVLQLVLAFEQLAPLRDLFAGFELNLLGGYLTKMAAAIKSIFSADGFNGVPNVDDYKAAGDAINEFISPWYDKFSFYGLGVLANDSVYISQIGENLMTFASKMRAIYSYREAFKDTTPYSNLASICEIIQPIATIGTSENGDKMVSENNFISEFMGTNDPASFGRCLLNFCKILCGSSDTDPLGIWGVIKDSNIEVTPFENIAECAEQMLAIATLVPTDTSGSLMEIWSGDNSLPNFANKYLEFVKTLPEILKTAEDAGVDGTSFDNITKAAEDMLSIMGTMRDNMLLENGSFIDIPARMHTISAGFIEFGEAMLNFSTNAIRSYNGFNSANALLKQFVNLLPDLLKFDGGSNITDFFSNLKETAESGLKQFLDIFENSEEKGGEKPVEKAISKMFSNISRIIGEKEELMHNLGRTTMAAFYGQYGMNSKESEDGIISAMEDLLYVASNKIDTKSFYEVGKDAAFGFARGLNNSDAMREVRENASWLAQTAYDEAMYALDEHSPSKKMMQVGEYAGEGFAIGLENWIKAAGEAGYNVGDTALDSLREALSNASSEIQNDEEFNPTITPVLDLSNIEENAGRIGGILNVDTPIQLAANAGMSFSGGVNGMLSNIQASMPEFTDVGIVDAINEMRYDINQMADSIRQMQIVMDTGELVGVITQPIDDLLGFNSMLNRRGVR